MADTKKPFEEVSAEDAQAMFPNAAKAGSSKIAVMPIARIENKAMRHKSRKKRLMLLQQQI